MWLGCDKIENEKSKRYVDLSEHFLPRRTELKDYVELDLTLSEKKKEEPEPSHTARSLHGN